jgi:hypothetical protein
LAKTTYTQSPEERKIAQLLIPWIRKMYGEKFPFEKKLYNIDKLKFNLPQMATPTTDIMNYIPGGEMYAQTEQKIAPAFWDTYQRSVENPLINRFAGSGTLGSPVAGASGAAMDALANQRGIAGNQIASNVYQAAMNPMLQAYQTEYGGEQARNLAQYGAQTNAAMQQALQPWQAQLQMKQYPFQILPSLLGGTMPQPVVEQPSGGGK